MELNFKKRNKTIIIQVIGEIDHYTSQELRWQTESAMTEMGGKNIIYLFQDVVFMDSSGIGMLIGRYKQIQALGGCIAIAGANEMIQQIIRLSGVKKVIPVFCTLEEAIAYMEGGNKNAV